MANIYVGPSSAGDADGTSWANRYGTLNDAEDNPVSAGDVVYVGPGVYRETLTVDVSGSSGSQIKYIGDVTGENTDGVGGVVRITGSDDDQSITRNNWITSNSTHRVFRGFRFDMRGVVGISLRSSPVDWVIEDCALYVSGGAPFIKVSGDSQDNNIIRRCLFFNQRSVFTIEFEATGGAQDVSGVVENCIFLTRSNGVEMDDVGGVTVRNCHFIGCSTAVRVTDSPPVGFTANTVNNCTFEACTRAVRAVVTGELVEDYNTFFANSTNRTNVDVGANSVTYPMLLSMPIFNSGASQISGFKLPWWLGELSEWSQVRAITGSSEPSVDLFGIARPTTASKNSWGPVQFPDIKRETTTIQSGSVSVVMNDAARMQIKVPHDGDSVTVSIKTRYEADYAGTLPQMIIKQSGQSDRTTTDTGSADSWNNLTDTFTPSANPEYFVIELVSDNTATSGSYATYFDTLVLQGNEVDLGDFEHWLWDRKSFETYARATGEDVTRIEDSTIYDSTIF